MSKGKVCTDEKKFILFTCIISGILAILYSWKIIIDQDSNLIGYFIIGLNLIYIPFAMIFKKKWFHWFYLVYCVVIICTIITQPYLFFALQYLFSLKLGFLHL